MTETEFSAKLCKELKKEFKTYEILEKQALLYKLMMDANGKIQPSNYDKPTRGNLAFETDIMIKKNLIPYVILELKVGGFSTHDVLTYSIKALKHKEVYPNLRYGMEVFEVEKIDRKFFIHNVGFDFAFALKSMDEIDELKQVLKSQIKSSKMLVSILSEGEIVKKYVNHLKVN